MQTREFEIGKPSPDEIQRTGDFELLPNIPQLPIITSQPANNINQYTWVRGVRRGRFVFQKIKPIDGIYRALEGTEMRWTFYVHDPDNVLSQNPYSGLSYKWKKDGIDITSLNLLNMERGVKSVKISRESCTPDLSGDYVCEVTNRHGTVETIPLRLQIFSPKNYPRLYTNLLVNGNAESSVDGWSVEPGIVSTRFGNTYETLNASSLGSIGSWYKFKLTTQEQELGDSEPSINIRYAGERFRFSTESDPFRNLIEPWIKAAQQAGENWRVWPEVPEWMTIRTGRFENSEDEDRQILPSYNRWMLSSIRPNLVSNENPWDGFGTFFPSMRLIDKYNKNESVIGLEAESTGKQLSYFTRDKIRFEKDGGEPTVTMRQTINVADLADFTDGNVYGIANLTYQFFAYVGIGISGYKIKVTRATGEIEMLNWNIASTEDFYKNICDPAVSNSGRITIAPGSDIEIIPLTEDTTQITLNFRDEVGNVIGIEKVQTPTNFDIWAVKEKAYLPISLGPMFLFIKNAVTLTDSSNIKVFGQTITSTRALEGMFGQDSSPFVDVESSSENANSERIIVPSPSAVFGSDQYRALQNYIQYLPQGTLRQLVMGTIMMYGTVAQILSPLKLSIWLANALSSLNLPPLTTYVTPSTGSLQNSLYPHSYGMRFEALDKTQDANAKFLGQKIPFGAWNSLWPEWWEYSNTDLNGIFPRRNKSLRCVEERGAAAMFAVEKTATLPRRARSVEVVVNFKHTSDAFHDNNPEVKQWTKQELYADYMGQGAAADVEGVTSGNSLRFSEYGNPRCGITKMKFTVVPNNFVPDESYPSYILPPSQFTVVGLSKKFVLSDSINTAKADSIVLQDEFTRPNVPTPLSAVGGAFAINPDGISYLNSKLSEDLGRDRESQLREKENLDKQRTFFDSTADAHTEAATTPEAVAATQILNSTIRVVE